MPPLQAAINAEPLMPLLARLCSSKRTVEFTEHQFETWLASLSVFDPKIVNEAIIRIAHDQDPFPDLGKLVMKCEALRRERAGTPSQNELKLGKKTLLQLADAWEVEVER
jgi:hypothetical protein